MLKRIVKITVCLFIALCVCSIAYYLFDYKSLKIAEKDVKQIEVPYLSAIFSKPLIITDKKEISDIIGYLNSLKLRNTKIEGSCDDLPWYRVKIKLKNNTEKVVCVDGNICTVGSNHKLYEIGYNKGAEAQKVFGNIMQKEQGKNGGCSVEGKVVSVKYNHSGDGNDYDYCFVKDKNNVKFNVDMNKAIVVNASGKWGTLVNKGDMVRIFYKKNGKTGVSTLTAFTVYINENRYK